MADRPMTRAIALALVWAWSYACYRAIVYLPTWFVYSRIGLAILPMAGLYGYTDGGWLGFRETYNLRTGKRTSAP